MLSIRRTALVVLAGLLLPCLSLSAGVWDNEINGLKVVPSDGAVRLEISKTGDIEFKAFRMSSPDRLVVDCVGAKYDLPGIEGSAETSLTSRVRTSQYQVDPVRGGALKSYVRNGPSWPYDRHGRSYGTVRDSVTGMPNRFLHEPEWHPVHSEIKPTDPAANC